MARTGKRDAHDGGMDARSHQAGSGIIYVTAALGGSMDAKSPATFHLQKDCGAMYWLFQGCGDAFGRTRRKPPETCGIIRPFPSEP